MKVTLRKANALQASINEAMKTLEFRTNVSLNEFQKPEAEVEGALKRFADNVVRREGLLNALHLIRRNVAVANAANIDAKLNEVARLEKEITFYTPLAKSPVRMDPDVLHGKLAKLKGRETTDAYSRYSENEVATAIFAQKDLDVFRSTLSSLKKAKQKIQDELLELNVQTTIELTDEVVNVLRTEEIL